MKEYEGHASCGFCRHYGSVFTSCEDDVCYLCEVRQIRELLEEIADNVRFEHDLRYRRDDEEFVRNCEHCEHADIYEPRYKAAECISGVWCALESVEEGVTLHGLQDCCDKWQRIAHKTKD